MAYEELKAELEEYGFVVLHDMISRPDAERLEKRVTEIMSRQPDAGQADQHLRGAFNYLEPKDDPLFAKLVTHPVCLELARHFLGEGFQMTEVGCRWRKPGAPEGPMHVTVPLDFFAASRLPLPNVCFVLAFAWMLNDLTRDTGATLYLPFSHHAPRLPRPRVPYKHLVAGEAPSGSVVIHHGGVWHQFAANTSKDRSRMGLMSGYIPYWLDPHAVGWRLLKRGVRDRMPAAVQQMNRRVADG
jgi:ectoine hydroxylase-related dioxygenase (phytanoyl-CoA dioxygenase family)